MANLFNGIMPAADAERFDDLLMRPGVRIERIVSTGQATPAGAWQDQSWDEWVLLVEGAAGLELAGSPEFRLGRGDHLLIPAGTPHRVAWTDPDRPTIWLAVHFGEPAR
jgi:cupin 2 domain-containing protein